MISISALVFDPDGHMVIDDLPDSRMKAIARRVNRVATLDGAVAVNDQGVVDGDRQFVVEWRATEKQWAQAERIVRLYSLVLASNSDGVFECAPQSLDISQGVAELTLLPTKRLSP